MQFSDRKHPRLKNQDLYSAKGNVVHIIIGTHKRYPYFHDADMARELYDLMIELARQGNNSLYAYCIMPDHVHILTEPSDNLNVIDFVKHLKGRFISHCRKKGKGIKFQKSFYDHILRSDEDVYTVTKYIIGNPVRAGIEKRFGDYPYAGSLEFNL